MPNDMNDGEAELQAALRCHDGPDDWLPSTTTDSGPGALIGLAFVGAIALLVFGEVTGCEELRLVRADPVPIYVEGDFDYDEDVDLADFAVFQRNFTCEYGGGPG